MTIIGIDPGSHRIGYGVIDYKHPNLSCLSYGTIEIPNLDISARLILLNREVKKLIKIHKPEMAAVEKLFFFKNAKTAIQVAESRGVIMHTLATSKLRISEFTPLEVKKIVSGYGMASKVGIQKMVRLLLKLDKDPQPDDAADALALGICGALSDIKSKIS
jgi:crossover junction endodeoxyribonuclease RuvC